MDSKLYKISKTDRGWIVEKRTFKYCFLGIYFWQVWRPYVKSSGLDVAWHHHNKDYAIRNLFNEITKDISGY